MQRTACARGSSAASGSTASLISAGFGHTWRAGVAEQPRLFAGEKGSATGKHPPFRHLLRLMIAAAVLLIIVLGIITGDVEKWLWMRQLDYAGIFWTLLSVQWAMFCSAFVFAFLYLSVNLRQAVRNRAALRKPSSDGASRG
jgi:hypothetical protein